MDQSHVYRILVMRIESQYNALGVFEEELICSWKSLGMVVDSIYTVDDLQYVTQQEYDFAFVMNGGIFSLDRQLLDTYFRMPVYSYYVDHPLHLDFRVKASDKQHCIVSDKDFKGYMDRHYQLLYEPEIVMQAGVEGKNNQRPFAERRYPVVFCGSYRDYNATLEKINAERKSFSIFLNFMIEEALKNPVLTMENIYDRALEHFKFPLSEEEYTEFLFGCRDVELYLRGYYRAMVVKGLVEAGIPVEVYGNGWDQLGCDRKDLLHCHAPVDYREMLDVFADAQIVINVMPWTKAGFHDRVACGMLNGALVFSDETAYMREQRLDGEKMVTYSLDTLQEISQKVAYYLEHIDEAARIAGSGCEWARETHTWKNRAEQFLQIFDKDQTENVKTKDQNEMDEENITMDLEQELKNTLELWEKYQSVLFQMQSLGISRVDRTVFLDFLSQLEELAAYIAELKQMCCNGGGMIWIETTMVKMLGSLKECMNENRFEDAIVLFQDVIVVVKKNIEHLQELLSFGLYHVNLGNMHYNADNGSPRISTLKDMINALDPDSMNPLEHFFFLESHNKMTKWSHYFEVYHRHFEQFRNRPITLLEIGVWGGGSLQMWKQYFGPQCNIIGVDIMEECKGYEEDQIKIYIGSQEDRDFLQKLKEEITKVDIIIDDGGHTMNQQIVTFEELFPILADGGVYLCEDMHTSYWPNFGGGYGKSDTFVEYSKNFVDRLHARYSLSDNLKVDDFTRSLRSIHYYDSMVVLEKGEHKPSMPFWIE